jgi:hypothetical protein
VAAGALIWRGSEWNLREGGGYCSRRETVTSEDLGPEEEDGVVALAAGSHTSARGGEKQGTGSGLRGSGPWADSDAGPDGFPGALFHFFIFFSSFLFLIFLFASYILHKCFKQSQTNFKSFLKSK